MERWTLRWKAGDSLALEVLLEDESGSDLDLSGCTASWVIGGTSVPTTVRGPEGIVALHLTPAQTAALREGSHALRIHTPGGDTTTVLLGSARRGE